MGGTAFARWARQATRVDVVIDEKEAKEQFGESKAKRIHAAALRRYKSVESALSETRDKAEECIRFAMLGEQWDEAVRRNREDDDKPCLTINKLPAFLHQITNEARKSKPSIKVSPVDNGADVETAEVIASIIRHIEKASQADIAYDTAIASAATNGFGFFRLGMEYAHPDSFDVEARILAVDDPLRVFWDVDSDRYDAADWSYCFFIENIEKGEFSRRYKRMEPVSFGCDTDDDWGDSDGFPVVRVAEYWRKEMKTRKLLRVSAMGSMLTIREDEFEAKMKGGEVDPGLFEVVAERDSEYGEVKRYILSGADVLEEDAWPGSMIPVCPVWGDRISVGGKKHYIGFVHNLMDAQRHFNYQRSTTAELVTLAPKTPFLVPYGSILPQDKHKWEQANIRNYAYLEYDADMPMPQRQPFAGSPSGNIQEAMMAADDLKSISGIHDASLGREGNETSGRAIMARQRQGDTSNFHFVDNRNRAIAYAGRCLVEIIPTLYSQREAIRIVGADDAEKVINLRSDTKLNDDGEPAIYDLSTGVYDVSVTPGPATGTAREQANEMMLQVMERIPGAAQYMADIFFENMDVPGADKLAERARQVQAALMGPAVAGPQGAPQQGNPVGAPIPQQPMAS